MLNACLTRSLWWGDPAWGRVGEKKSRVSGVKMGFRSQSGSGNLSKQEVTKNPTKNRGSPFDLTPGMECFCYVHCLIASVAASLLSFFLLYFPRLFFVKFKLGSGGAGQSRTRLWDIFFYRGAQKGVHGKHAQRGSRSHRSSLSWERPSQGRVSKKRGVRKGVRGGCGKFSPGGKLLTYSHGKKGTGGSEVKNAVVCLMPISLSSLRAGRINSLLLSVCSS